MKMKKLLVFLVLSALMSACGGGGGGTETVVIPVLGISVDGNVGDWGAAEPVLLDKDARVDLSTTGGDLRAIYLARSEDMLYVRFEIYTDQINTDNKYRVWFDNNMDGGIDGEIGDRQIEVSVWQGSWRAIVQTMEEPHRGDLYEGGPAAVSGATVEASVPLSIMGLGDAFILTANIRDENYLDIDERRSGVVVHSR